MMIGHSKIPMILLALTLAMSACTDGSSVVPAGTTPPDSNLTPPDSTQTPPPDLSPGRGRFRHIDILSFTRGLNYNVPPGERQLVEQWLADHVDVNEGDPGIKTYDPDVEIFRYDLDLTAMLPAGEPLPDDEEAYLHFAEETIIQRLDLAGNPVGEPITIPGSPPGEPLDPASRIRVHMWDSDRYVFNPADPGFRTWQGDRLLARMGNEYDGVFLDEHSPGFKYGLYLRQNRILSGGAVRELGGLRPGDPNLPGKSYNQLDADYSALVADWLAYLRDRLQGAGKFVLINPAQYYWIDLSENEYTAAGGVTLEFVHVPFDWSAASYGRFAERVRRAVADGVRVDLFGRWCTTGPASYTPGNYASSADRYRMWRLASYYYVRGDPYAPGIAYFDPSFCNENSSLEDYLAEWLPAYEYDIGDPVDDGYVLQEGQAACSGAYRIYARNYTFALVLVRPQDDWDCHEWGDASAAEVVLDHPLRMLRADGTLSEPVSSVLVRNAEAVILVNAP